MIVHFRHNMTLGVGLCIIVTTMTIFQIDQLLLMSGGNSQLLSHIHRGDVTMVVALEDFEGLVK
jgi:hypothetical protein